MHCCHLDAQSLDGAAPAAHGLEAVLQGILFLVHRVLASGGMPNGYEDFIPATKPILSVATFPSGSNSAGGPAPLVYDYRFDRDSCSWVPWMDQVPELSIPAGAGFSDIMVPTKDTVRYAVGATCLS